MEHKKIELKPCPLCGGKARFKTFSLSINNQSVGFKFEISCEKCRASLSKIYETNFSLADDGRINVINDEIDMKRFAVITIFTNKMKEIDDYYNSLVNDNNNRRKQVDVMNNKVATIFKKN